MIERGATCFGPRAPGVPGCGSVGDPTAGVLVLIQEATEPYLEALEEGEETIPSPQTIEQTEVQSVKA